MPDVHLVRVYKIRPLVEIPQRRPQQQITIRLSPGLAGKSGPLGLPNPVQQQVPVAGALMALAADGYAEARGETGIRLDFNNDDLFRNYRELDG